MKMTLETARRIVLRVQGLDGGWTLAPAKEGVAQVVERLGAVQIDTISVVQRAHDHILWTRHADARPPMLPDLLATDRRVFEYWTHAVSYLPMRDYRFYLPAMRMAAQRWKQWHEGNRETVAAVLERIRREGGMRASDFETPAGHKSGWWKWKPAKTALECLFFTGELMVSERRSFQRVYDLTERCLPSHVDTTHPTPFETAAFKVRRLLGGLGIASAKEIARWGPHPPKEIAAALPELIASGEILSVEVEGLENSASYMQRDTLETEIIPPESPVVHILSPFDSLIRDRARLKAWFGFDYLLECYVPAPKRRFGYFCLPILDGERIIGQMDAKALRKEATLLVRMLHIEPDFRDVGEFPQRFVATLTAFANFNDCERIVLETVNPPVWKSAIIEALAAFDGKAHTQGRSVTR